MKSSVVVWALVVGVTVALGAVGLLPSCSSSSPVGLAQECAINTDCDSPLICAFGLCHEACAASRDCSDGATCVLSHGNGVCELSQEKTCNATLPCVTGLTCADDVCRTPCTPGIATGSSGGCLSGQACTSVKGIEVCIDKGGADAGTDTGVRDSSAKDRSVSDATPSDSRSDAGKDTSLDTSDTSTDSEADAAACMPPDGGDAGPFPYTPSNFDPNKLAVVDGGLPDGGVDWTNPPDVTISSNCGSISGCGLPKQTIISLSDGTEAFLFVMRNFTVESTGTLTLASAQGGIGIQFPLPVIFAVLGQVEIEGAIELNGHAQDYAGAGGNPVYGGSGALGPGGGQNGYIPGTDPSSAPGGGSFCGTGGMGGGTLDGGYPLAQGGTPYGNAKLIPLVAGSAGGYSGPGGDGTPGPSGGALQISAGTSIVLNASASINAGGEAQFGGGGSGGAILLEAPTIVVDGILAANGGSGGAEALPGASSTQNITGTSATASSVAAVGGGNTGKGSAGATINGGNGAAANDAGINGAGGGGAGWIRINSACPPTISPNAIISPSVTTKCSTQGKLNY
jgi:hypothetical protein